MCFSKNIYWGRPDLWVGSRSWKRALCKLVMTFKSVSWCSLNSTDTSRVLNLSFNHPDMLKFGDYRLNFQGDSFLFIYVT